MKSIDGGSTAHLNADEAATIGKIVGCFGVKGYVKVVPYTSREGRFKKLKSVAVGVTTESAVVRQVGDVITRDRIVLIKFAELPDRTAAEALTGCYLFVKDSDRPKPPKGSYYLDEVIDCEVWSTDGQRIGVVEEVFKNLAQDVWAIRAGEKVYSIPAVKEFIKSVDVKKKRITIQLIDGLLM